MSVQPGIVICGLDEPASMSRVQEAKSLTPAGRVAAFCWTIPDLLQPQSPLEALVSSEIMGSPSGRSENKAEAEWLFYANVVARHWSSEGSTTEYAYSTYAVMFRKQGPPPYARLRDGSLPPSSDELDVKNPAFTRDVANNTWMLPSDRGLLRLACRIRRLLSWSDEDAILLGFDGDCGSDIGMSTDLLGRAEKTAYEWGDVRSGEVQLGLDLSPG